MSGAQVEELLVVGIGAGLSLLGLLFVRRRPGVVLALWLLVVCAVPVWVVLPAGPINVEPQAVVAWGCLVALLPLGDRVRDRFTLPDACMAALVLAGLAGVAVGQWSVDAVFRLLVPWLGAYLLGRLAWRRVPLVWVYRGVVAAFAVVALLAMVEFITGFNPFLGIPGSGGLRATWAHIQIRGGVGRAEGAFGHSIALGGCLATAVPITLAARLRPVLTVGAVVVLCGGAVVTFSRIGMGTLVLGLLLTLLLLPSGLGGRLRAVLVAGVAAVGVAVLPLVAGVFASAGDEATDSAAYRGALLPLLGTARWLGLAGSAYRAPDGQVSFGTFRSIDNALLLLALKSGLVSLVVVLVALGTAVVVVVSRRGTAPTIALVAQIPAFASVALITQYSTWVWFLAGLAVASQVAATQDSEPDVPHPLGAKPPAGVGPAGVQVDGAVMAAGRGI